MEQFVSIGVLLLGLVGVVAVIYWAPTWVDALDRHWAKQEAALDEKKRNTTRFP